MLRNVVMFFYGVFLNLSDLLYLVIIVIYVLLKFTALLEYSYSDIFLYGSDNDNELIIINLNTLDPFLFTFSTVYWWNDSNEEYSLDVVHYHNISVKHREKLLHHSLIGSYIRGHIGLPHTGTSLAQLIAISGLRFISSDIKNLFFLKNNARYKL